MLEAKSILYGIGWGALFCILYSLVVTKMMKSYAEETLKVLATTVKTLQSIEKVLSILNNYLIYATKNEGKQDESTEARL